jgi:hypothetical protein
MLTSFLRTTTPISVAAGESASRDPRFHNVDAIHSRPVPEIQRAFSLMHQADRNIAKDSVSSILKKYL